ncbi:MAG: serine/threonine-protein phosphatase [Sedimentisphaerales bacterium]|nr:serine/threonine-protein phosphatase [Sedimentisphaerales bacterium]
MTQAASREQESAAPAGALGVMDSLRTRLCGLRLHRTELWGQIRRFGSWFESEASRTAETEHTSEICVELGDDGEVGGLRIGTKRRDHELARYQELWDFLNSLGVRQIGLDARLECNQIEDVMALLYCHRRAIGNADASADSVAGRLRTPGGVHVACTQTSLCGHTLTVRYTYCTLRFSRVVHQFESRRTGSRFHDHRTLFYAAPRYGALVSAVIGGPGIVVALLHAEYLLARIFALSTGVLFGLTYAFFMVVGSVEFDNEEKAYNLRKAYGRLKDYTDRIQADIERARVVQETFLPAPEKMPFRRHLEWAASFVPAAEVGGDYFDVAPLDDSRVAILFSDVSGHGMAAAFITAVMKTTFRAWLDDRGTLEELAQQMNANLARLVPLGSFAAAFLAVYDVTTRGLVYANCGHQPEPWCLPADGNQPIRALSDARNLVMGIQETLDVTPSCMLLEPGDTVLFVSDGIVENPDADGDLYGAERFEAFVQARRSLKPEPLVEAINAEADRYSRDGEQSDDRTVLVLRVKN